MGRAVRDLLDCSLMCGPGVRAPQAAVSVDEGPLEVEVISTSAMDSAAMARRLAHRRKSQEVGISQASLDAVRNTVWQHQPITRTEVEIRMARTHGLKSSAVHRALLIMQRAGRIDRVDMRERRGGLANAVYTTTDGIEGVVA